MVEFGADGVPAGYYRVLVVDPPWNQGKTGRRKARPNQNTVLDYPTLSKQELAALPLGEWSCPDQAYLWLWATNSKDRVTGDPVLAMAFELMALWGFQYYTTVTWDKGTGPCPFGPYQVTTEHVLFGYRGKGSFKRDVLGKLQTCFRAAPGAHSAKPDVFYQNVAQLFEGPRLDVFARQEREGYDGWGNEYGCLEVDAGRRSLGKGRNGADY